VPAGRDTGLVSTVEQHGWCALRAASSVDFAYTVGLWHSFRLPELVMFGLDGEGMQHWLDACVARVREHGWPDPAAPFAGVIDGFDTQLRPVDESWRDALFGTAHRFYAGWPVPVWQLVWPDAAGRWPWEEGATMSCRLRQASAWLPVGEHPAGGFPLPAQPDSWALTTRSVLDGSRPPTLVVFDDDAFDVLDERGHDADDLCLGYLGHLVLRHPVLREVGDLPAGTAAAAAPGGSWRRTTVSAGQRAASTAGWQRGEETRVTG